MVCACLRGTCVMQKWLEFIARALLVLCIVCYVCLHAFCACLLSACFRSYTSWFRFVSCQLQSPHAHPPCDSLTCMLPITVDTDGPSPTHLPIYQYTHPHTSSPTHLLTYSPAYLLTCPPTHLLTCPPTHLLRDLPTYLITCLPTHPPTYSPTYLLTYPPTHLLTYSSAYLITCPPTHLPPTRARRRPSWPAPVQAAPDV